MAEVARRLREYYSRMLGPKYSGEMERSRARRHRRILLRRNAAIASTVAANGTDCLPDQNGGGQSGSSSTAVGIPVHMGGFSLMPAGNGGSATEGGASPEEENAVPVIGAVAVAGRQREMEDAVSIHARLCTPAINRCLPVHYFGVYDGHGGPHFAIMCKTKMHAILKEELMGLPVRNSQTGASSSRAAPSPVLITDESALQEAWRVVITRCFWRTEMAALNTCCCGSVGLCCSCDRSAVAYSGSTAVAVVLTEKHIVVGNCGDSRAILYRGGRIIPLSFDHKPDRADEKARILASGGRVFNNDTARVQGILAMSRAIGDTYLKPYVISEPEVTFTRRDIGDEFLVIASDGLWDMMTNEMICRVTGECLREERPTMVAAGGFYRDLNIAPPENEGPPPAVFPSRSASAAALLTRLALARNSGDNISVVVVDLKRTVGDDEESEDDNEVN
ncbi:Serine/threonine protein phosphatase [Handroanthus impetiginosus]|uniref:protein-serine/threonine phosphatase n=1 Tax=Handroanthus impetiginosus TaxID=429701 RepID=A0A2G9FXM4_9LAMI|nr:Serine/threonine protein phosphatase [Handroanthus impetiginosus]